MRRRPILRACCGLAVTALTLSLAAACSSSPKPVALPSKASSARSTTAASPTSESTTTTAASPASAPTTPRTAPPTAGPAPRPTATPSRSASPPGASAATTIPPAGPGTGGRRTIALNPGHNGGNGAHAATIGRPVPSGFGQTRACDTTGTNTNAGYSEHAFNWDVTLRVRALLQARGVNVILTRPDDTGVGPCIDERARIANAPGVSAVVSIHADGAPTGGHGFHICDDSRQPAGPVIAARSHALTVAVHNALVDGSGLTTSTYIGGNGYYPRSDLAGLNLATVPATFIELGNMRNAGDAALQSSSAGRARMAAAIAAGILAWLG